MDKTLLNFVSEITGIVLSFNDDPKSHNINNINKKLKNNQNISNLTIVEDLDLPKSCRPEEGYYFQYKNETFFVLNNSNETMNPTKQNYYFRTIDNFRRDYHIPILFIYKKKMHMIVISPKGEIIEFYQSKDKLVLPELHYFVRNATTFVDFNNFDNIDFRLISENPRPQTERNFDILQSRALNILHSIKIMNF